MTDYPQQLYDDFAPVPGDNNKNPPLGAPEQSVLVPALNDCIRQVMAALRELGDLSAKLPIDAASNGITDKTPLSLLAYADPKTVPDANQAPPVGSMFNYYGNIAKLPGNWVLCQGQTVTLTYADGSTEQKDLPDDRDGRYIRTPSTLGNEGSDPDNPQHGLFGTGTVKGDYWRDTGGGGNHAHGTKTGDTSLDDKTMPKHGHGTRVSTAVQGSARTSGKGGLLLLDETVSNYPGSTQLTPADAPGSQIAAAGEGAPHSHSIQDSGQHTHRTRMEPPFICAGPLIIRIS